MNLLWSRWNKLKEESERLKPFAIDSEIVRKKIRSLKNEASVLKFAIEDQSLLKLDNDEIVARMKENREAYRRTWG